MKTALHFILFISLSCLVPVSAQHIEVDLNPPEKFKTLSTKSVFVVISNSQKKKSGLI